MNEILTVIQSLLQGKSPGPGVIATVLFALAVYKIVGEYLKDLWFRIFPSVSLKQKLERLQKDVDAERSLRKTAEAMTERSMIVAEAVIKERDQLLAHKIIKALDSDCCNGQMPTPQFSYTLTHQSINQSYGETWVIDPFPLRSDTSACH